MAEVKLHPDWLAAIGGEFEQPYMAQLKSFLADERASWITGANLSINGGHYMGW